MSHVKFNHVFTSLLVLSALSAFVIPPKFTNKAVPQVQTAFAPVSVPARGMGAWLRDRVAPRQSTDKRKIDDVKAENALFRTRIFELEAQLQREIERNIQWLSLGKLKDRCVPVEVVGDDAGPYDSLNLGGSTLEHVRERAIALYPGGVAGEIQRAGPAGATLRLITDRGFKVSGYFARLSPDGTSKRLTQTILFEGIGGAMVVKPPLSEQYVREAKLEPNDVALADENDWSRDLVGQVLGTLLTIQPSPKTMGITEIRVQPPVNLKMLDEVMVLKK